MIYIYIYIYLKGHPGRFGRGVSLYRYRSQLSGQLCVRIPLPTGLFLSFNSGPVMLGAVGSLASSGVLGPSTWVHFPLEPLAIIV